MSYIFLRRNAENCSIVQTTLYDMHKHNPSYMKYVMRKFQYALLYIQDDVIAGISIWRIVTKDISKQSQVEPYIHIMVLSTQQEDSNLRSKMIYDIDQFSIDRGIMSILIELKTHDEGRLYQYLGYVTVSVFPSIMMRKIICYSPDLYLPEELHSKQNMTTIDEFRKR